MSSSGTRAVVVGVVGARGGVGASTFGALLAARLARRTATALVDLAGGAGLDVLLGLENRPGPRWPDLVGAGELPGEQVLDVLPRWGPCAVLSSDRHRPGATDPASVEDLVATLAPATGALVLDLDRGDVLAGRAPVGWCDLVALVVGRDLASVGGALALRAALGPVAARTGLAVRSAPGSLSVTEVTQAVGLPLLCRAPHERGLGAAAERGALPVRGRAARAAGQVAATVLDGRAA